MFYVYFYNIKHIQMRYKRFISLLIFSCVSAMIFSCRHEPLEYEPKVCYSGEIEPELIQSCAVSACHDAATQAAGFRFDVHSGVLKAVKPGKPEKSKIYLAVSGSGAVMMPPSGLLPESFAATLRKWIEQGAENSTNCGQPCDTFSVKYAVHVRPVIETHCAGCHAAGSPSGIDLNGYQPLSQYLTNNSQTLLNAINFLPPSPMPKGGNKLPYCEIRKISIWLANGFPEN